MGHASETNTLASTLPQFAINCKALFLHGDALVQARPVTSRESPEISKGRAFQSPIPDFAGDSQSLLMKFDRL